MPSESWFSRLMMWTMICGVSAAPSFFISLAQHSRWDQIVAMVLGVAIFIAAYTWATCTDRIRRLNDHPLVRRTAYIGYGTRIIVSIVWPIGLFLDIACGFLSDGILERTADAFIVRESFAGILIWTLTQGAVLNVVLITYMLIVYAFQLPFYKPVVRGLCAKCGYDLRASAERCPECGEPIPTLVVEPH